LRKSRDNWKRKFQELKGEHKRLQNQVHDVRKSREEWRGKAEQEQISSATLRAEIARLQTTLAAQQATGEKKG
jgi:peptidoglycan hydrolase CwlO-like protein